MVKWRGYDDTGNSWLLKKDALGGGAKQMLRDFDLWYDSQPENVAKSSSRRKPEKKTTTIAESLEED